MDTHKTLAKRFQRFSKYLRMIAIITLILYLILVSISTGQEYMVLICYILLLVTIVSGVQSIVLQMLSRLYQKKK